jgi:hypothetical protein
MSAVERELQSRIAQLGPEEKRRLLEYTRTLGTSRPRGTPGSALRPLFGSISEEDARQMSKAIEEGCEQVDADGW